MFRLSTYNGWCVLALVCFDDATCVVCTQHTLPVVCFCGFNIRPVVVFGLTYHPLCFFHETYYWWYIPPVVYPSWFSALFVGAAFAFVVGLLRLRLQGAPISACYLYLSLRMRPLWFVTPLALWFVSWVELNGVCVANKARVLYPHTHAKVVSVLYRCYL